MTINIKPAVAQALRALRQEKGLTQGEVAESIGITTAAYNRWENAISTPDLNNLATLSVQYDTPLSTFLPSQEDIQSATRVIRGEEGHGDQNSP